MPNFEGNTIVEFQSGFRFTAYEFRYNLNEVSTEGYYVITIAAKSANDIQNFFYDLEKELLSKDAKNIKVGNDETGYNEFTLASYETITLRISDKYANIDVIAR